MLSGMEYTFQSLSGAEKEQHGQIVEKADTELLDGFMPNTEVGHVYAGTRSPSQGFKTYVDFSGKGQDGCSRYEIHADSARSFLRMRGETKT